MGGLRSPHLCLGDVFRGKRGVVMQDAFVGVLVVDAQQAAVIRQSAAGCEREEVHAVNIHAVLLNLLGLGRGAGRVKLGAIGDRVAPADQHADRIAGGNGDLVVGCAVCEQVDRNRAEAKGRGWRRAGVGVSAIGERVEGQAAHQRNRGAGNRSLEEASTGIFVAIDKIKDRSARRAQRDVIAGVKLRVLHSGAPWFERMEPFDRAEAISTAMDGERASIGLFRPIDCIQSGLH